MTGTTDALAFLSGPGPRQLGLLALALVLSALIGIERELRQKSAGLRTHTLVGLGAALFMLVSKYGFGDVLVPGHVVLDPSRVAAQIVTGIGFIGGGVIFVRRDLVRGLTTAAVVWLTAAVGMACGAGLILLAVGVTAGHLAVMYGLTAISRRLPVSRHAPSQLRITYLEGRGALRNVLATCTERGFVVVEAGVERTAPADFELGRDDRRARAQPAEQQGASTVVLHIQGRGPVTRLVAALYDIPGVLAVNAGEAGYPTQ